MTQKIQRFDFDANSAITGISFIDVPSGGTGGAAGTISAGTASASVGGVSFANSNGVSFGVNGQTITATVQTNYLTTAMASNAGSGFVAATAAFAGTNASGTIASNGISVSVGNYLTTARASTDAVGLNTALTAGPLAWTVNSSGLSLNAGSAAGTTSGFSGNLISGSMTHNTAGLAVSLNHPAWLTTAAQSNHSHGNPTLNLTNLSGTTASASNGFTLSLSAGNYLTTARASNDAIGLNTAGSNMTWTANSSGLSIDARGYAGTGTSATNASVTLDSNGLSISVAAPGGGAMLSFFENVPVIHGTQTFNAVSSTVYVYPFILPQNISISFVRIPMSMSQVATTGGVPVANSTITGQVGYTHGLVIYTQGVGASANSLQSYVVTSGTGSWGTSVGAGAQSSQQTVTMNGSFNQSGVHTNYGTGISNGVSSGSYVINSTLHSNATGVRFIDIPFATSLSAGNYWIGIGRSWSSANNSSIFNGASLATSNVFVSQSNITWGILGSATNTSNVMRQPGAGFFTTNASLFSTGSINAVDALRVTTSNLVPYFQFVRKA